MGETASNAAGVTSARCSTQRVLTRVCVDSDTGRRRTCAHAELARKAARPRQSASCGWPGSRTVCACTPARSGSDVTIKLDTPGVKGHITRACFFKHVVLARTCPWCSLRMSGLRRWLSTHSKGVAPRAQAAKTGYMSWPARAHRVQQPRGLHAAPSCFESYHQQRCFFFCLCYFSCQPQPNPHPNPRAAARARPAASRAL